MHDVISATERRLVRKKVITPQLQGVDLQEHFTATEMKRLSSEKIYTDFRDVHLSLSP